MREMDQNTSFAHQLDDDPAGPVVLVNHFSLPPDDVDTFLTVWADDAHYMKQQPGFISTQLHRGTAGSTTFVNIATWETAAALRDAVHSPGFRQRITRYPAATTSRPHLFQRHAVPGICMA